MKYIVVRRPEPVWPAGWLAHRRSQLRQTQRQPPGAAAVTAPAAVGGVQARTSSGQTRRQR